MIRDGLRRVLGRRSRSPLPYDMFDRPTTQERAKAAKRMERIYHKGQERIWDGREVLAELVERHGPPQLDDTQREAIINLFAVILWGELAAWKVSADLSNHIEPMEAKLAATSQAHDEARHFYVMHDYLKELDAVPKSIHWGAKRLLEEAQQDITQRWRLYDYLTRAPKTAAMSLQISITCSPS